MVFDNSFNYKKIKDNWIEDINKINNIMNNLFYKLLIFFINLGIFLNTIYLYLKNLIISDSLDNLIYNIEYINHIEYTNQTIYYLSLYEKILRLFSNNILEYDINDETKNNIKKIINFNDKGYLKINYYDKEKNNNVLINLSLFKKTNFLFKHTNIVIYNIIQNFIKNNVVYEDKNILYTELKYKNKTEDITKPFKEIKDSFKNDNIKLYDLIFLLNNNICNLENNESIDFEDFSLVITDGDLEEKIYKNDDYINFKTLYEDLAERED